MPRRRSGTSSPVSPSPDPGKGFPMPSLIRKPTSDAPGLSVVVASVNGWELLGPTLRSLDALPERPGMEIIVVEAVGGETRRELRQHRPAVEVIEVDEERS